MVDTARVRQIGIGAHGRKTDRGDVEVLARAVEADRIPHAHVLSPERGGVRAAEQAAMPAYRNAERMLPSR